MEFYISPQSGQFYMINVLENQWLSVTYTGRQFVPFLWWSLVWPDREENSRPTVREADTLVTEPTRHGKMYSGLFKSLQK